MMLVQSRGVLITDGNERSALAATRALGQRGIPVYVGADAPVSLAGRSRYCAGTFQYPSPWKRPQDYAASVLESAERFDVAMLLPMTDVAVELIGSRVQDFPGAVAIPIPSLVQYRQLSNKYELTHWAKMNGVPVPESLFLPDGVVEKVLDQITRWPVIVKPGASLISRNGLWAKTSVHVAGNADELLHLYEEHWYLKQPSLIQQRIVGEGQGVFGLFSQGRPLALFAHRRLREKPPGGGVSVLRESISLAQPITDYAIKILQSAQWHGVAMVEFKVDRESGVPYLIEVNGRFWGSLQLAIDAGVNFPFLTYQLATAGWLVSAEASYRVGVKSRWFLGDLDQLLLRLRKSDEQLGLSPGSLTKGQALREFFKWTDPLTRPEVFRLGDMRPGLYEIYSYLGQLVRTVSEGIRSRIPDPWVLWEKVRWKLLGTLGRQDSWLRKHVPLPVGKILVLCKGNICRSPFAAELLRQRVRQLGIPVQVASAGIEAVPNQEAYPLAKRMAIRYGVLLSAHRTTLLSGEMVSEADLILVMETGQARSVRNQYPQAAGKVVLLGQFGQEGGYEIPDPYGQTGDTFSRCYDQITKACEQLLSFLARGRCGGSRVMGGAS
jgi:protein-tyrosine-phosphatase/predicted ATP-grasp superfamily ATP-dependent carboligase